MVWNRMRASCLSGSLALGLALSRTIASHRPQGRPYSRQRGKAHGNILVRSGCAGSACRCESPGPRDPKGRVPLDQGRLKKLAIPQAHDAGRG